jgi:hypothetical protein
METWETLSKFCQEAVEDGRGDTPVFHFFLDGDTVNDFFYEETPLTTEQIISGFEAADYVLDDLIERIRWHLP